MDLIKIFVLKNGQEIGPLTRERIESDLLDGTLHPDDSAKLVGTEVWTKLGTLANGGVPPPIDLHWAIVVIASILTKGLFVGIWCIVMLNWVRKLDKDPTALILTFVAVMFQWLNLFAFTTYTENLEKVPDNLRYYLVITSIVMQFYAAWRARSTMLKYFNETEPIGLKLNPALAVILTGPYLQYHLSRISSWKLTGLLPPQA